MKLDVTTFVLTLAKFICHKKVKKLRQELLKISSFSYLWEILFARWPHFFWWWWTWKEVHQVMFWLLWWPRFDDHQHENCVTLICTSPNSFVMPYWTNRYELEKMGDKFFRIIASPFACAKLVCCSSSLLHSRHSSGNWCLVVSFPP